MDFQCGVIDCGWYRLLKLRSPIMVIRDARSAITGEEPLFGKGVASPGPPPPNSTAWLAIVWWRRDALAPETPWSAALHGVAPFHGILFGMVENLLEAWSGRRHGCPQRHSLRTIVAKRETAGTRLRRRTVHISPAASRTSEALRENPFNQPVPGHAALFHGISESFPRDGFLDGVPSGNRRLTDVKLLCDLELRFVGE